MPALRHSEDTEFNDALRARGIIPQLEGSEEKDSKDSLSSFIDTTNLTREAIQSRSDKKSIEEIDLDEDLPAHLVDSWKSRRINESRKVNQLLNSQTTGLNPIGRDDFVREVNEASKINLDHPYASPGTGVVVFLWNNSSASSHFRTLLNSLSIHYPTTRFLSIPGSSCIPNYPDEHQPTILCYRNGNCLRQYVGLGQHASISHPMRFKGLSTQVQDLENEFIPLGVLDSGLRTPPPSADLQSADGVDDDDDDDVVCRSTKAVKQQDRDDSDLDI